ncbi:hypothetical protein HZS_4981 [Henneguya salminicola]|nr:hypothetical protein HZS_4981 [Henneguya salminicola]
MSSEKHDKKSNQGDTNIELMQKSSIALKNLSIKIAETIDEYFKNIYQNRFIAAFDDFSNYTEHETEIVSSLMKEVQNYHYILYHVLSTLRQQEIQKTASELLTPTIVTCITQQKSANTADKRKKQLAVSSTINENINNIDNIVKYAEIIRETTKNFAEEIKNIKIEKCKN